MDTVVDVIAHGSRAEAANEAHREAAAEPARGRHRETPITLLAPSGAAPAMADLLTAQIEASANPDR